MSLESTIEPGTGKVAVNGMLDEKYGLEYLGQATKVDGVWKCYAIQTNADGKKSLVIVELDVTIYYPRKHIQL